MPALLSAALLAVLAPAVPCRAVEAPVDGIASMVGQPSDQPESRSMLDLVSLGMSQGKDENINGDIAQLLGLRRDLRTRLIHYPAVATPDHLDRALEVVYKNGRDGREQPLCLLLDVTKVSLRDSTKYIQRRVLKLSLGGELQGAAFEEGDFEKLDLRALPRDQAENVYKGELNFWQFDSLKVETER